MSFINLFRIFCNKEMKVGLNIELLLIIFAFLLHLKKNGNNLCKIKQKKI